MPEWTPERLCAFSNRVADAFRNKRIKSPVHLCSETQAAPLIEIFRDFRPGIDYLFSNWRNSFHCLLAGVPEDELFDAILAGRSMYFCSREHRIICSSIVGGILPIALGVALGIKRSEVAAAGYRLPDEWGSRPRVHCFIGDMCARTGLFHEFKQFCEGHDLPVRVVVEDNGFSTNAITAFTWGFQSEPLDMVSYKYARTWPHCGLHERVSF